MKGIVRIRQRQTGFSMIELLLILVIIAVLAAIAIPVFSAWLPNYRLSQAARDLYSNLQRAKVSAIKSNSEWRVYFDDTVTPGTYSLCSGPGDNDVWDGPPPIGDDDTEMTINLSNYEGVDYGNGSASTDIEGAVFGAVITYAPDPVTNFSSRGTVDLQGYVYLSNSKGSAYGVGTPSPAGVIVLKKYHSGNWE